MSKVFNKRINVTFVCGSWFSEIIWSHVSKHWLLVLISSLMFVCVWHIEFSLDKLGLICSLMFVCVWHIEFSLDKLGLICSLKLKRSRSTWLQINDVCVWTAVMRCSFIVNGDSGTDHWVWSWYCYKRAKRPLLHVQVSGAVRVLDQIELSVQQVTSAAGYDYSQ